MSDFTPGPWKVYTGALGSLIIENETELQIAEMVEDYDFKGDEWKANAHLISQTPAMFEWMEAFMTDDLKKVREYLYRKDWRDGLHGHFTKGSHKNMTAYGGLKIEVDEILSKARGES